MNGRYYSIWHDIKKVLTSKSAFRNFLAMPLRARRYDLLKSTFMRQEYSWLAGRIRGNTTLVDIGANIGDTPIYFAMLPDVKRVIAYEPDPDIFSEAERNVAASPYKAKISLVNKAISAKDDSEMQHIELNKALKGLKNVAIKCDCEGEEATIFDDADLRAVYAIQLEYHNCLDKVVRVLRQKGFKVTSEGPREMGMAYATRQR